MSFVLKFGRNEDVDGVEDIWDGGGSYSWPSAAAETTIASSGANAADDAAAGTGARTVSVQGLDSNYNKIVETATMNGANNVTLTNQFLRVFRAKVETAGTDLTNKGAIQVKHGGTVLAQISVGIGQTLMSLYTVPADYPVGGYLIRWYATLNKKTAAGAVMALQVKPFGGAWNTKYTNGVGNDVDIDHWTPYGVNGVKPHSANLFAPKTDIRIRALVVTAADLDISAGFDIDLR